MAHKLAAVLDVWRAMGQATQEPDYYELVAMQLMEGAKRALFDLLPAARSPVATSS